jgi:hypothetical protein
MLAAVESFLERNPLARFWTFTSGPRCRLLEVRDRLRRMHRRLSQLNAQPFMQSAGVEIVFRSSELGTPETHQSGGRNGSAGALERDAEGLWFHVHAHTIVCLKFGYIAAKKWEHLIRQVWNFWGHHWDAGDSVRDARECLKYVTKPGEMLKLTGEELAALAHQLRRIKLAQPMGILATEIKGRAALGNRLIKVQSPEGRIYKEVKDWNKLRPVTQDVRDLEAARRLSPPRAEPVARIVSRLLPAVGPRGVKEPRVIVMTAGAPDIALLRSHAAITPIIRASADEFAAGLRIRVHTCTATVLTPADWIASEHWPPPTAADLAGFSR